MGKSHTHLLSPAAGRWPANAKASKFTSHASILWMIPRSGLNLLHQFPNLETYGGLIYGKGLERLERLCVPIKGVQSQLLQNLRKRRVEVSLEGFSHGVDEVVPLAGAAK